MSARRLLPETKAVASTWPLRVYPEVTVDVPALPVADAPGWQRLQGAEFRRRLLHILPGFFPFLLWVIPHKDPWGPILANSVIAVTAAIVIHSLWRFSAFARPGEENGRASILGYAFPMLAAMSAFRGREELGVMTLAILAFGDGSATVGGLLFGGKPLPWNPRKTLTGLLCFWVMGGILGTVVYWGESRPGVSWMVAASVAGVAVFFAGLLESLQSRINDNLRVGFASAIIGAAMHFALVG
jgi:dolichol kinase